MPRHKPYRGCLQTQVVKKRKTRKPGSVRFRHLSSRPTPRHRAGRPHLPVYLVLQAPGPYPPVIAAGSRERLPRVFTLTRWAGGIVSVALSVTLARAFPLGSMVLCVARTFLSLAAATDRPA